MMKKKNNGIRAYAKSKDVYLWEVREKLGYEHDSIFSSYSVTNYRQNEKRE